MVKVTIEYTNSKKSFNVEPYLIDVFDKVFSKFCLKFNKFIEGAGVIDANRFFMLGKPFFVSTKGVTAITYEYVEEKAVGRKKKGENNSDSK